MTQAYSVRARMGAAAVDPTFATRSRLPRLPGRSLGLVLRTAFVQVAYNTRDRSLGTRASWKGPAHLAREDIVPFIIVKLKLKPISESSARIRMMQIPTNLLTSLLRAFVLCTQNLLPINLKVPSGTGGASFRKAQKRLKGVVVHFRA